MTKGEQYLISKDSIPELAKEMTHELSKFDGMKYYSHDMEKAIVKFFNKKETNADKIQRKRLTLDMPPETATVIISLIKNTNESGKMALQTTIADAEDLRKNLQFIKFN